MITQQEYSNSQIENEKLLLENVQLKKDLEKEEFLHKTLYKQWNELNLRMLAKEREFNKFKSGNVFYKYAFYFILFISAPVYYFLSSTKGDEKIISASKAVPPPALTAEQETAINPGTVQLPNVKPEEKKIVQQDTIQTKLVVTKERVITNKPVITNKQINTNEPVVKSLTDSVRTLIYSEGWDAYFEKSENPYKKSPQKYNAWLEGWKDAEKDDNKSLTRRAGDTSE